MTPSPPTHLAAGKPAERDDFILTRRHRIAQAVAPSHGGVLLDFGCGIGAQAGLFAPHFDQAIALDVDAHFLRRLASNTAAGAVDPRVQPVQYDGFRIPVRDGSVDYAISFEVLEHVVDESAALSELFRVLRPGGTLVISVPNRWWVFETHGASLPLLPWNRVPFFSWLPKRIHDRYARAQIYRRREIVAKLKHHGFDVRHAGYITAPMDVIRWKPLQSLLRSTLFRPDQTSIPFMATAVMAVATKPT